MFVVDTNILIHLLNDNERALLFLMDLRVEHFSISTISSFEVLVGATKQGLTQQKVRKYLGTFHILPFTEAIAAIAASISETLDLHKSQYKDVFIAATCMKENATLITADKGFKKFKKLKVHLLDL